jgi:hypothetical protein
MQLWVGGSDVREGSRRVGGFGESVIVCDGRRGVRGGGWDVL